MNRGIARRTMFERRADVRFFLAGLARCVREGLLEVHAFTIMGTHFHFLARSPVGKLATAMQRIQLGYSRYFNRSRKRDGSLVRGRYKSNLIQSLHYRRALVAYIDSNPVRAGLASGGADYPYGSAFHYSRSTSKPIWLERGWIENEVCCACGAPNYIPNLYAKIFPCMLNPAIHRLVRSRINARSTEDPLDDLLNERGSKILAWMRRKARLADGTDPGLPVCDIESIESAVIRAARIHSSSVDGKSSTTDWKTIRVGLLHELCAITQLSISQRIKCSQTIVGKRLRRFRFLIYSEPEFAKRIVELAQEALKDWEMNRVRG